MQQKQFQEFPPAFREDGSFDLAAFLLAPPVLAGLLFIAAGLLVSFLITQVFTINNNIANMALFMLCCCVCFSGTEQIINYLNRQREFKKRRK